MVGGNKIEKAVRPNVEVGYFAVEQGQKTSPEKKFNESGESQKSVNQSLEQSSSKPTTIGNFNRNHGQGSLASQLNKQIEKILEDGLVDIYMRMTPSERTQFKKKGEQTTALIAKIISRPKFKISSVVNAIKNWLKNVPGVNKFFLEQTAKIKADKIVENIKR